MTKFATLYEQYVGWSNNINFICIRDQNSPPPKPYEHLRAGEGGRKVV